MSPNRASIIQGTFIAGAPRRPARRPGAAQARMPVVQANGANRIMPLEPGQLDLGSSVGKPLPAPVQRKMEALFGEDFSDVRIHSGSQAHAIGAIAFTLGSSIYFAPGRYSPDTPHGQNLLGHELTHVVQQRAGRVRNPLGSGLTVVQDHALEAEADRMGARAAIVTPVQPHTNAVQMKEKSRPAGPPAYRPAQTPRTPASPVQKAPNAPAHRPAAPAAYRPQTPGRVRQTAPQGALQATMEVNNAPVTSLATAWAQITAEPAPAAGWTSKYKDRLKLWIKRKDVYSAAQWYMTAQSWTFATWQEAARQLIAHVESRPNRKREGDLAQRARKSAKLRTDLVAAMRAIEAWITLSYPGAIQVTTYSGAIKNYAGIWQYLEAFKGQYRNWYPNGKIHARMQHPLTNHMSTNFVMLREIFYALSSITHVGGVAVAIDVRPQGARHGLDALHQPVRIDKEPTNPHGETRRADFTPESAHPWVQNAQVQNLPLGAGASNTTDGILYMANMAGVTPDGKAAIAWAAFVFWNKRYYKIQGYGHTFHEVMDVAHEEHGVAYAGTLPALTAVP